MTTVLDIQQRLQALGYQPGPVDGLIGPTTLSATDDALDHVDIIDNAGPMRSPPRSIERLAVPADWMPWAQMQRIIVHWTAGANTASALDREHYHILIEGGGKVVRGKPSIDLNQAPVKKGYAAHTLNCNSGSIGVSLCGMAGAVESPFSAGRSPITRDQWEVLPSVLILPTSADSISVTPSTVLSHPRCRARLQQRSAANGTSAACRSSRPSKAPRLSVICSVPRRKSVSDFSTLKGNPS